MVKKQQSLLHTDDKTATANVDRVINSLPSKQKKKHKPQASHNMEINVADVGGPQHPKFKCPARDSKCNKYCKKGHWSKVSTSTKPPRRQVQEVTNNSDSEFFFGEVVDSINDGRIQSSDTGK